MKNIIHENEIAYNFFHSQLDTIFHSQLDTKNYILSFDKILEFNDEKKLFSSLTKHLDFDNLGPKHERTMQISRNFGINRI